MIGSNVTRATCPDLPVMLCEQFVVSLASLSLEVPLGLQSPVCLEFHFQAPLSLGSASNALSLEAMNRQKKCYGSPVLRSC